MTNSRWQFWIDVGGTFTDCIARQPDGVLLRRKVLSSAITKGAIGAGSSSLAIVDPARFNEPSDFWSGYTLRMLDERGTSVAESKVARFDAATGSLQLDDSLAARPITGQAYELASPEEAPLLAIRLFLGLQLQEAIPPVTVRLGTTRGTNALLTRRGARTALVTTRGLGDVLQIGYQNRPRLFDLAIHKPPPLYCAVAEIDERLAADGSLLIAPREEQIHDELARLKADGIESLAICLLNAYASAEHEQQVARVAERIGFDEISLSSRVAPLMKIVPRGDTTVVDAYLNPILRQYVARLQAALRGSELRLLSSAGGLLRAENFTGKDSILSGPAGGVVGFSRIAAQAGFKRSIGFDMGGTSTDVSRFDGQFEYEHETQKAGVRIVAPMLAIETVAAGGGSVCRFDGVKLVVGPESAGADPGPACYGRGGPLTVTDCNFYLGRILPEHFPFPLNRAATAERLAEIAREVQVATGRASDLAQLADGFLRIANANMAAAIRSISIAKGYDPRDYVLVPFGAAGPQHACAVASELGMRQVLSHRDAGVLSALGMGLADVVRHRVAGVYRPFDPEGLAEVERVFQELESQVHAEVLAEGVPAERVVLCRELDLRYQGVDAALTIDATAGSDFAAAFAREHLRLYGYEHPQKALEILAARVEAIGPGEQLATVAMFEDAHSSTTTNCRQTIYFGGRFVDVPLFQRDELPAGAELRGPAVIVEQLTTTLLDAGWTARVLPSGEMLLRADSFSLSQGEGTSQLAPSDTADPVLLEVFNNLFTAIATQMGITLRSTSSSVNVKERLDFSCAVFTAEGNLVVNAPHIPVHLGAMSQTVQGVLADNPQMRPGDVFVTNDPFRGGSHLPDVTVVTPVFDRDEANPQLLFFTASRAHHAEIGGITPGSMPPFSQNLAEEGVLIRNFPLLQQGTSHFDELAQLLSSGPHPSRAVPDNLADISAQLAANRQGANDLERLIERYSLATVQAYMQHIQAAAEQKMRVALAQLAPGRREFVDYLDDGTPIRVAIDIRGSEATIDFTGTGGVLKSNLNANRAIVTAAVLYCLRLLIRDEIPLNQGVLAPVEIVLPECLLNPPASARQEDCPAIVGGNVETSQRVVDVLLGALGLAAASQGTMNNVLFGDTSFGYYETVCGGSGATAECDGASAVHTHMTNTRLTDPEVLERRYPVRLRQFAIRAGSGGNGRQQGGDGVIRQIEFLRPLTLSLVTQRRGPYPPYGLAGGEPGALGRNRLLRVTGEMEELPAQAQVAVLSGDILILETPGGGGFGPSPSP